MSVESLDRNELKQRVQVSSTRRRYVDSPHSISLAAGDPNFAMFSDETYSEFYWDGAKKWRARWGTPSVASGFLPSQVDGDKIVSTHTGSLRSPQSYVETDSRVLIHVQNIFYVSLKVKILKWSR